MAETRFIKTVTFGGYEKTEVDKRLEYLYSQVFELKNELREAKLTVEEYKKGSDEEKAHETILAGERAKLTQVQVQKETLSDKLKTAEEDNRVKDKELEDLRKTVSDMSTALADTNAKLAALQANSTAEALSAVFIEAQKSANTLVETSKKEAAEIDEKSKQAADDMIVDANNKAKKIIYEAEKRAAEITAEAENNAEQMKVASGNLKAELLSDVDDFSKQVAKLRAVLEDLEKDGIAKLDKSEKMLNKAEKQLKSGGVPVFREPKVIAPVMPKEPEYEKTSSVKNAENKKKSSSELEKLQAMAAAIGGKEGKAAADGGDVDLAALMAQANALGGGSDKKDESKDSGSVDLASLLAQAESLGGGKKEEAKKSDGGMDLAALLAQAEALDK